MQPGSPYPRPPQPGFAAHPSDRVFGVVIVVLSSCCTLSGVLASAQIGEFWMRAALSGTGLDFGNFPVAFLSLALLIALPAVSILVGWGVCMSAKWALELGVVIYGLTLILSFSQLHIYGAIFSGVLLTYCALRLSYSSAAHVVTVVDKVIGVLVMLAASAIALMGNIILSEGPLPPILESLGHYMVVQGLFSIAVGWGMFKSAKWAFIVGAVLYGLGLLFQLDRNNIWGILISGALFTYCLLRLTGRFGPRPA